MPSSQVRSLEPEKRVLRGIGSSSINLSDNIDNYSDNFSHNSMTTKLSNKRAPDKDVRKQ